MERKAVGFCAVVVVLGVISAATGFAGEFTRVKASDVYIEDDSCVYPSSPALALGIISALSAVITQVYIIVTFGSCRCCRNDPNSTPVSILLSALSWVATVVAVVLLLAAAGLNNKEGFFTYTPQAIHSSEMESRSVGFCVIVAGLGIISAATGFAAETTRVKDSDVYIEGDSCFYPSSPALALGIIAAVFAIVTRIYITVTFGGSTCCRSDPNSTPISKFLYVLSWVASVIAVVLLLAAAGINNETDEQFDSYGYITCYVVKPGIYASGAVLALLSAVFGIAAYVTLISSREENTTNPPVAFPSTTDQDLEKSSS